MTRIWIGERGAPEHVTNALRNAGFEVVTGDPPAEAGPDDFSLVPGVEGITSALRHEIGNALTSVLGFSELLARRADVGPEVAARLTVIRENAQRIRLLLKRPGQPS